MNAVKVNICKALLLIATAAAVYGQESQPHSAPHRIKPPEKYPATCGDLLAELHQKPVHLEFLGCKTHPDEQMKPLEAEYRVKGVYAAQVERYLGSHFPLDDITKTCCSWSSGGHFFTWKDGNVYYLVMNTEDTIVEKKSDWRKIDYFYVKFKRAMDEP